MPPEVYNRLTRESAERTIAEGREVSKQDLVLEALEGTAKGQEPERFMVDTDFGMYIVTDSGRLENGLRLLQ